jgi:glycosyltransferase involved in cell wall biosynthesis
MSGVISTLYEAPVGGRLSRIFEAARIAVRKLQELDRDRRIDLIISHDPVLPSAIRRAFPTTPLLGTFHSPVVDENRLGNWKYAPNLRRRLTYPATWLVLWLVEWRALRAVSRAHTLSELTWGLLSSRYPRACRRVPWHKIPGSFDPQRYLPPADRIEARRALGIAPGGTVLLTVRRLVPRNGVDRIVSCAASLKDRVSDIRFLIGGTGPLQAELQRQIEAAGVSNRVQLLGHIPEDRLPLYYQAADVFLLPTRNLECFGLPVIEAMGCGCPSLVMPDGGPAEVCRDHPLWIAEANTDEAFEQLVWRYLSARGKPQQRATEIAEEAARLYSNDAIRPSVLKLAEECAAGGV